MSFFQSMEAGVTSRTSQAMKLPICSRYSLLALSRVTQKLLLREGGTTTVRTVPRRFRITTRARTWPAASAATARPNPRLRRRMSRMSPLSRSKSMARPPSAHHAADVRRRRRSHRGQRTGGQMPVQPVDGESGMPVRLQARDPARHEDAGGHAHGEGQPSAGQIADEEHQDDGRGDVDIPESDLPPVVKATRDIGFRLHVGPLDVDAGSDDGAHDRAGKHETHGTED